MEPGVFGCKSEANARKAGVGLSEDRGAKTADATEQDRWGAPKARPHHPESPGTTELGPKLPTTR
jgi:hypothetical protein